MEQTAKKILKRISNNVSQLTDKKISPVTHAPKRSEWRAYIGQTKPHWEDITWRVKEPQKNGDTEVHLGFYSAHPGPGFSEGLRDAENLGNGKVSHIVKNENGISLVWRINLNDETTIGKVFQTIELILQDFLHVALKVSCVAVKDSDEIKTNDNSLAHSEGTSLYEPLEFYNKINGALAKVDDELSNILLEIYDENYGITPGIFIEWIGEGIGMENRAVVSEKEFVMLLTLLEENVANHIKEIVGTVDEEYGDYRVTQKEVYEVIEHLQNNGYFMFCCIKPQEWSQKLFVYKKIQEIEPLIILHHFSEAKNSAEGWFEEFFTDFDKTFDDYLSDNYSHLEKYYKDNQLLSYGMESSTDWLGNNVENFKSNFDILNLNEVSYEMCVRGIKAAEKFC